MRAYRAATRPVVTWHRNSELNTPEVRKAKNKRKEDSKKNIQIKES